MLSKRLQMNTLHIVGQEGSFTHDAAVKRYAGKHTFVAYTHHDLVKSLIKNTIPAGEPSVVPLWNSNAGVINMNNATDTEQIFLGVAGRIYDLWPWRIEFLLAIPDGALTPASRMCSVKVAEFQCSKFLNANGLFGDRFEGCDTTTLAMECFLKRRQKNDGILCGKPLLDQHGFRPLDVTPTNPNNMTVFATVGCLPNNQPLPTQWSLGCFVTPIEGHELPTEFIDYYETLVSKSLARQVQGGVMEIPEVLFIVRYDKSKALMLLEMPGYAPEAADWEPPYVGVEITILAVGALQQSYSAQAAELMRTRFACNGYCFYGSVGCYMWISPHLGITVHGYDKDLVRDCARMQVLRLKALVDSGLQVSVEAKALLQLVVDPARLGLSPDSEPETP